MEKPRYSASKRMIYGSLVAAWGLVYLLAYGAIFGRRRKRRLHSRHSRRSSYR